MAHYYQPTLSGAVAQDGGSVGWIGYHRRPRPPSGFPLLYCGNREYLLCTGMRTSCRYKRECSRLNSLTANFNICDRFHFGLPSSFCPSGLAPSGGVPFGVMSLICLHALGGGLLFTFILWNLQPLLTMRSQTFCTSLAYPFPQL